MAGNISRERGVMQFLLHFKEVIYYSPDLELHIYSDFKDKLQKQMLDWIDLNNLKNNVKCQPLLITPL